MKLGGWCISALSNAKSHTESEIWSRIQSNGPATPLSEAQLAGFLFLGERLVSYVKPWRSYEEQAERLIERGLVADPIELAQRLSVVSYYRLSGYWFRLYESNGNQFRPGTTLEKIWERYRFDRRLRTTILDGIERIEVGLRSDMIYRLTEEFGPFALENPQSTPGLDAAERYQLLAGLAREYKRSRELFIEDFRKRHGSQHSLPPAWMLCELMSFGNIVYLYQGLPSEMKTGLAVWMGTTTSVLESWLRTLNVLRNVAAHHSRTWDRRYGYKPKIPNSGGQWSAVLQAPITSLFVQLSVVQYLLARLAPSTQWRSRLEELIDEFPSVPVEDMGFPREWRQTPPWRN